MYEYSLQMEQFVEALRSFEAIHQWWSPQTFQRLDNQTLKTFVEEKLVELSKLSPLLQTGTVDEFESFIAAILDIAPKMITVVLACCLATLHAFHHAQEPVSHSIVDWYRQEGWAFPPFCHEQDVVKKIDDDAHMGDRTQPL